MRLGRRIFDNLKALIYVTALALAVRIPLHSNRLADYLLKLTEIAKEAADAANEKEPGLASKGPYVSFS